MTHHFIAGTPRRFKLIRDDDPTGVSGTGIVAMGCLFFGGTCVLRWNSEYASTAIYNSEFEMMQIHGHGGSTRIVWIDELPLGVIA